MAKARVHVIVEGNVQGVFFRSFTKEAADRLGVTGWAKNLADGRVEAVLEGEKDDLDQVIDALMKGPPSSRVDHIDISWEPPADAFVSFEVRY